MTKKYFNNQNNKKEAVPWGGLAVCFGCLILGGDAGVFWWMGVVQSYPLRNDLMLATLGQEFCNIPMRHRIE
jgi:hypothetical protein